MALGTIEGLKRFPIEYDGWTFDEDDLTLIALLQDPIYMAELLWEDHNNREYGNCYKVRDYQYPLFRANDHYAVYACGRSVGKTESIKARSQSHIFKRINQNLLVTAPELIHLLPLTDAIEDNIRACRLTRELLDTRNQQTGFQHRPFQANFIDSTKIVGRIPQLTGKGVKGQHQPELIVDEGQDYPDKGYIEVNETVMKDILDINGKQDFHYHVYGVHSGNRGTFYKLTTLGGFKLYNITAIMRPDWDKDQKNAAKAMYGGTSSPDFRRNILGEPGAAASAFFSMARLMACVDQGTREGDPESSVYNTHEYQHLLLRSEEVEELKLPMGQVLDLPSTRYSQIWAGMDIGLTTSPTVMMIFAHTLVGKKARLKLIRRITMERFRTKRIRETMYAVARHFGGALQGFGIDSTGLGFPILQEMEDDESCPAHLEAVMRGYFFNTKVPVAVQKEFISEESNGALRDQYGMEVVIEEDPLTGVRRYVTRQPMIEASTRYIREWVDSNYLMLPFDPEIVQDMTAETQQRVQHVAGMKKKPNALHILDAMRVAAMVMKAGDIEEALEDEQVLPVLDMVVD